MDIVKEEELIRSILAENKIEYTEEILKKLEIYYDFLVEYNNKVNLTAITEKSEVYVKHFADSMLNVSQFKVGASICDIGTGAGFPGVVIKIVRPDLRIVLVDSLNKRVQFLNELTEKLNLKDIETIHARAEDEELKARYLNKFDYVVARAVANMTTLTEYCLPYVKIGGQFVAYKSINAENEAKEAGNCIRTLGGKLTQIKNVKLLPNTARSFIIISKIAETSKKYPRGMNRPRLKPLL